MGIIGCFFAQSIIAYAEILGLMLFNLIYMSRKIQIKALAWFTLLLIPAILAMFISSYFFATNIDGSNMVTPNQAHYHWQISLLLSVRLYTLAIISFAFTMQMPRRKIICNLLQQRILPLNLGFALLAVNNALNYLSQEFKRIQIAYQMRYHKRFLSPKIMLPLLVAAARYAHQLSISMISRGLNKNRSYYQPRDEFHFRDFIWLMINAGLLAIILK